MTDTAQLREALEDEKRIIDPDFDDYTIEVNSANFAVIYQAAIRQLAETIREAGALIITPDEGERSGWPKWAWIAVADSWESENPTDILDALRDAMPPEDAT